MSGDHCLNAKPFSVQIFVYQPRFLPAEPSFQMLVFAGCLYLLQIGQHASRGDTLILGHLQNGDPPVSQQNIEQMKARGMQGEECIIRL